MQVVAHNLPAQFANRQLGITDKNNRTSAERLSTGYRINRASDDAAGLQISEKLRWQVRGLNRSALNIQDGVSLCQVADGALHETTAVLQRMRELAVQSANGTNCESDRLAIEMEFEQLWYEVDRIAYDTNFNDDIYPLNGSATDISGPSGPDSPPEYGPDEGLIKEKTVTFTTNRACTYDGKQYQAGDTITVTGLTTNGVEVWINGGGILYWNGKWDWGIQNTNFSSNMGTLKKADLKADNDGYLYYVDKSGTARYAAYDVPRDLTPDPLAFYVSKSEVQQMVDVGLVRYMTVDDLYGKEPDPSEPDPPTTEVPVYTGGPINIQSGSLAWQAIQIYTVNATCEGLGITDVTVATEDSAGAAMEVLDDAIGRVSAYRSMFGAVQNRLEHAKMINDNTSENTQSAESKMRDTDMAAEMVQYAATNILAQAGQAMLAQANQSSQRVLDLIA